MPRAAAQGGPSRAETLLLVQEYGPNSLDMQGIGSAQPVNGVAINCYDRLIRFKPVPLPDGAGASFNMTTSSRSSPRAGRRRPTARASRSGCARRRSSPAGR